MTPLKAIRAKCIDCCCGNMAEVNRCNITRCALHPFRMGKNENMKRTKTPEMLENLKNGRVPFQSVGKSQDSQQNPTAEGKDTTEGIISE